jgi:hypothetical protein
MWVGNNKAAEESLPKYCLGDRAISLRIIAFPTLFDFDDLELVIESTFKDQTCWSSSSGAVHLEQFIWSSSSGDSMTFSYSTSYYDL